MIKRIIWQIRQFFNSSPAKGSWAYSLHMWAYDLKVGRPVEEEKPEDWQKIEIGMTFPGDLNTVLFTEAFRETYTSIMELSEILADHGVHMDKVSIHMKEIEDDYNAKLKRYQTNVPANYPDGSPIRGPWDWAYDPLDVYGSADGSVDSGT